MLVRRIARICAVGLMLGGSIAFADARSDIGYTALKDRGVLLRDGSGIPVLQVEADNGAFFPNTTLADFNGKSITTTGSAAVSDHATWIGSMFYGIQTGIAPGVTHVRVMNSNNFMASGCLSLIDSKPPLDLDVKVINNSWVSVTGYGNAQYDIETLRRLDWMIDRDDVTVVTAVENGSGTTFPNLLAPSYNSIAVGVASRAHSRGPTSIDSAGPRSKPDLVVIAGNTSQAAALTSGAAALLRSEAEARSLPVGALAIKSLLMAGANRTSTWKRGATGPQDDKIKPLDPQLGAGLLRVDRSFDIMVRGEKNIGSVPSTGWDNSVSTVSKTKPRRYTVRLNSPVSEFAAFLNWNRTVQDGPGYGIDPIATLSDLDMTFERKYGTTWRVLGESRSDFDNVESITLGSLPVGTYRMTVFGNAAEDYALAWRSKLAEPSGAPVPLDGQAYAVPEPGTLSLLMMAALGLLRRRRQAGMARP